GGDARHVCAVSRVVEHQTEDRHPSRICEIDGHAERRCLGARPAEPFLRDGKVVDRSIVLERTITTSIREHRPAVGALYDDHHQRVSRNAVAVEVGGWLGAEPGLGDQPSPYRPARASSNHASARESMTPQNDMVADSNRRREFDAALPGEVSQVDQLGAPITRDGEPWHSGSYATVENRDQDTASITLRIQLREFPHARRIERHQSGAVCSDRSIASVEWTDRSKQCLTITDRWRGGDDRQRCRQSCRWWRCGAGRQQEKC